MKRFLQSFFAFMLLAPTGMWADSIPVSILKDSVLTFTYADEASATGGESGIYKLNTNSYTVPSWHSKADSIVKVVFEQAFVKARPTSTYSWFYGFSKLTTIEGIEYLNTSDVASMSEMFRGCSSLTSLDVSNFNTQNVTTVRAMFYDCKCLTSLDVSNFNTQNVTDMYHMFSGCKSLTSLDVSKFDTQNVTDMNFMFSNCSALTSLDLSNFDTQNVTDMSQMFLDCKGLASLDVSNFNTQKVTYMSNMFYGCRGLTSLDVSNFDTQNVTTMREMFYGCSGLTSLDIRNFDTQNVTSMDGMFDGCRGLTSLDLSNFGTQNVTSMGSMFSGCRGLTSLDVSNFDLSNCKDNMSFWMYNCSGLRKLNIGGNDEISASSAFTGVGSASSPCIFIINDDFDTSVLGEKHETATSTYYLWNGGYFSEPVTTGIDGITTSGPAAGVNAPAYSCSGLSLSHMDAKDFKDTTLIGQDGRSI